MKKIKYVLTSLFMLGVSVGASAYDFSSQTRYAEDEALDSVWLYYSINPDGMTVSVTQGPTTYDFSNAEIPETVTHDGKTYTVTEIAYKAFAGGNINIVKMANTITKIGDESFNKCSIDSISFSNSLKSIGEYAFYESDLRSVVLNDGIESIGNGAFGDRILNAKGYGSIKTVVLPSSLKDLGEAVFSGQKMSKIIIPNNITEIKNSTFNCCNNLTEIVFSKNLQKIGAHAFSHCAFRSIDTDFFPASCYSIGDYAFSNNSSLNSVELPNTIKQLGNSCFVGNQSLQSITFSTGMSEIPQNVCSNCTQLVDVNIPENIQHIGSYAFSSAIRLSSILLPESVTSVSTGAFSGTGITSFKFPSNLDSLSDHMFANCDYLTEIEIPTTVRSIEQYTFSNCKSLRKVILPEGLETISYSIFQMCENLLEVTIPSTVKTISAHAFSYCVSLETIELPDSLVNIGGGAFFDCKLLESMDLPKSIKSIGNGCFQGCDSLKIINIYHNIQQLDQFAFYECPNLKEVHIKSAIIPSIKWSNSNYTAYIENGNSCTLYVPIGCKATYEASKLWNNFDTIVEEEIGYDILYRVSASKSGQGTIAINGENKTYSDILSGSKVGVTFNPASGWALKAVSLNDKDVTAELNDNEYMIDSLGANMVFAAVFEELPVTLCLRSATGGTIDIPVVKGNKFTCKFTPDEGWLINNVRYNNSDVTSSLTENNEYTTPVIKADAMLTVAYESDNNSVENIAADSEMKAYIIADGMLVVEGAADGYPIAVYDVDGRILTSLISVDGKCSYQLPDNGVYIVKGISKSIKVGF